jgi:CTP-dependent riboflavin kinase
MKKNWKSVYGVVVRGHQVASKKSEHYPEGTIEMQIPFFLELGLDLTMFYRGTLNVSIAPSTFKLGQAEYKFPKVQWTSKHPAEDFSFSRCRLVYKNVRYEGWVYYPHPETKKRHFQNPSLIEIIAPVIPEIKYGDKVEIEINPQEIIVSDRSTNERA